MPFYEYQCEACANRVEALQKISDDPLLYCPKCNEPRLKKLISAAGFRLKGTGWYETDFKNSGRKSGDEKKSDATDGKSGSDSGGDKAASGGQSDGKSGSKGSSKGGSSGQSEAA